MLSPGKIRLLLAVLVVAAVTGIVAAVMMKGSRQDPQPVAQPLPQNIDVAMKNARFSETRDGTLVWELVADRAVYDKTGEMADLTAIRMVFTKTNSAGAITLTAATGEYAAKTRNVKLRGKVHVVTESGIVFDTESIDYLAAESCFKTTDKVNFKQERLSLIATGMSMDVKTEKAHFPRQVDATVTAPGIGRTAPPK